MRIEFEVDPAMVGKELAEILRSLSSEEKKDMALKTMEAWLKDPIDYEKWPATTYIIKQMRRENEYLYQNHSFEQMKQTSDFKKLYAEQYGTSRKFMIDEIMNQAIAQYKSLAEGFVKDNPELQKLFSAMLDQFVADYPELCRQAMSKWFSEFVQLQMMELQRLTSQSRDLAPAHEKILQRMRSGIL